MKRIRIAVFGCGRIANSAHLPAITALNDELDLVAVVDPIKEKAKAAQDAFSVPKAYHSSDEALADAEIDAVALCLGHYLHHPLAIQAAKAGKHVLVEKPMALTAAQADEMIKVADEAGTTLMVGQSRRFNTAILECKKRFADIGRPLQLITNWMGYLPEAKTDWWRSADKTGGLLIPLQGSHAVDFQLWMMDETPVRVYAQSCHNNPDWEGEDEAVIQMTFKGGAIGTVLLSFNAEGFPYERFIIGSKGTMYTKNETVLKVNGETVIDGDGPNANFERQYTEFASAIRDGREPVASGKEVRKVIAVLDAVRESIARKAAVEL